MKMDASQVLLWKKVDGIANGTLQADWKSKAKELLIQATPAGADK